MFPEASQLRDIHVAMGNPWWPPAPGWWLLLGAVVALVVLAWRFRGTWRVHVPIPFVTLGDWRWDAGRALRQLRRNPGQAPLKTRAAELSELLRRIAMARHGRAACAGLHGEDWLGWLADHDPSGFDWRRDGRLLLDAPYAPARPDRAREAELDRLIEAAGPWITARRPRQTTNGTAEAARRSALSRLASRLFSPRSRLRQEQAG
jgi:hypothetical protein